MQGKIIKIISNLYTVETEEGLFDCRARGKFRNCAITPLVGDICKIDKDNQYILEIMPRRNELTRPLISNVNIVLIVTSVKKPTMNLNLLDKMMSIVIAHHIEPVLCFTKLDLLTNREQKDIKKTFAYYKNIGYKVITNKEHKKLNKILKGKSVVVTGQTGAGKSTLLNKMDKNLQLKTDEISESLGRGKHTTRHVELFKFKHFYIADTPGFSSLDFQDISKEDIKNSFVEFQKYHCPFKNCMHDKERDCSVKQAVERQEILESRYQNYIDFIKNK